MSGFKELFNGVISNNQEITNPYDVVLTNIILANTDKTAQVGLSIEGTPVLNEIIGENEVSFNENKIVLKQGSKLKINVETSNISTKIAQLNELSPVPPTATDINYISADGLVGRKYMDAAKAWHYCIYIVKDKRIFNVTADFSFLDTIGDYIIASASKTGDRFNTAILYDRNGNIKITSQTYAYKLGSDYIYGGANLESSKPYQLNFSADMNAYNVVNDKTLLGRSFTFRKNGAFVATLADTNSQASTGLPSYSNSVVAGQTLTYLCDENGILNSGFLVKSFKDYGTISIENGVLPVNVPFLLYPNYSYKNTLNYTDTNGKKISVPISKIIEVSSANGQVLSTTDLSANLLYIVKGKNNEFVFLHFVANQKLDIYKIGESGLEKVGDTITLDRAASVAPSAEGKNGVLYANADDMEFVIRYTDSANAAYTAVNIIKFKNDEFSQLIVSRNSTYTTTLNTNSHYCAFKKNNVFYIYTNYSSKIELFSVDSDDSIAFLESSTGYDYTDYGSIIVPRDDAFYIYRPAKLTQIRVQYNLGAMSVKVLNNADYYEEIAKECYRFAGLDTERVSTNDVNPAPQAVTRMKIDGIEL